MSLLTDILPAKMRKRLYALYGLAALLIGSVQVGYASVNADQPTWLTACLAVFAFLGTALGFTAASNTALEREVLPDELP